MVRVETPVRGFNGVVAGVAFADGVADTDDPAAMAYFRNAGYGIDGSAPRRPETPEPADPRDVGDGVPIGTRLRDSAVDPAERDFLPPTNAGEANPHGSKVVAPGVHGQPPAPIVPGPVSSSAKEQEAIESAIAEATLVAGMPVGEVTQAAAAAQGVGVGSNTPSPEAVAAPAEQAERTDEAEPAAPPKKAPAKRAAPKRAAPAKEPARKQPAKKATAKKVAAAAKKR